MQRQEEQGFTIIELLAVISITAIVAVLAAPNFSSVSSQMHVSEDTRAMAFVLGQLRSEAVRLKTPIEIDFGTSSISWDIDADSVADGSLEFDSGSTWFGGTPASFSFNGLGLATGVTGTKTMTLQNGDVQLSVSVNSNGYVEFGS